MSVFISMKHVTHSSDKRKKILKKYVDVRLDLKNCLDSKHVNIHKMFKNL